MQIIYIRKKSIKKALGLLGVILILLLLIWGIQGYWFEDYPTSEQVLSPIYEAQPGHQQVGLLINVDWGEAILPDLLKALEQENICATFFITGRFAEKQEQLVQAIAAAGHEIGNHGYSHKHPDQLSLTENQAEIIKTQAALQQAGVEPKKYFAPAYGEKKEQVIRAAEELGYQVILWTLDTVDWQDPTVATIIERIVPKIKDGALILAHPKQCTLEAIPELARQIRLAGLEFKTLSQLIKPNPEANAILNNKTVDNIVLD